MKTTFVILAFVVLLLTSGAARADSWAYIYGGVDDPTNSDNGWTQAGVTEMPAWNVDTGEGNGRKALVIWHEWTTNPSNQPRYSKTPPSGHVALIWQMRFKIIGGQPTGAAQPYFERVNYNDGRSRLMRRYDNSATGATGDDFVDPDMVNDTLIGAFDSNWHTYTIVHVGAGFGASNAGSRVYLDGALAGTRAPGQTGNGYGFLFGIVGPAPGPYLPAELWVDYIAYGFDDTPDGSGNYGWDVYSLPYIDPDAVWSDYASQSGAVPEPSSLMALAAGLAGLALAVRRRGRR